jgi:uncharacterized protein (TIGR02246 family)
VPDLKQLVTRFWAAWCDGDDATMAALMAPDCSFDIVGGSTLTGRAEFLSGNGQFMATAIRPGPRLTIRSIVCEGDVVMCTASGEMTGAQTGLPYNNRYAWCLTFEDGLIAHVEEYCDTVLLAQAIFGRSLQ